MFKSQLNQTVTVRENSLGCLGTNQEPQGFATGNDGTAVFLSSLNINTNSEGVDQGRSPSGPTESGLVGKPNFFQRHF